MRKKEVLIKLICISSIIFTFFISNTSEANDLRWNLYFENIRVSDGSITANQEATITGPSHTEISFDVTLQVPGDYYEFIVDAVNNGTVDAMINQVGVDGLSATQKKYITYEITYEDGTVVNVNDKLKAGTREHLRVKLKYKENIAPTDLPTETSYMTLSLDTSYVQADENAVERDNGNYSSSETSTYVVNNGDSSTNNNPTQSTKSNSKISKIMKNVATGDSIIKYVIVLVLATLALLFSFRKKNHF